MSETDLKLIYERFSEIDKQLTQLQQEMEEMLPKKNYGVQWEESLSDDEKFDEEFK